MGPTPFRYWRGVIEPGGRLGDRVHGSDQPRQWAEMPGLSHLGPHGIEVRCSAASRPVPGPERPRGPISSEESRKQAQRCDVCWEGPRRGQPISHAHNVSSRRQAAEPGVDAGGREGPRQAGPRSARAACEVARSSRPSEDRPPGCQSPRRPALTALLDQGWHRPPTRSRNTTSSSWPPSSSPSSSPLPFDLGPAKGAAPPPRETFGATSSWPPSSSPSSSPPSRRQ